MQAQTVSSSSLLPTKPNLPGLRFTQLSYQSSLIAEFVSRILPVKVQGSRALTSVNLGTKSSDTKSESRLDSKFLFSSSRFSRPYKNLNFIFDFSNPLFILSRLVRVPNPESRIYKKLLLFLQHEISAIYCIGAWT